MNKPDNEFILAILQMFEEAYFQNLAFEALCEVRAIPHWQEIVKQFAASPEIQPETRAAFAALRKELEHDHSRSDQTNALQALLKLLPTSGKIQ
ncbi:MAG TPA: hypothetical protein VKQ11_20090 [Candidatus Sulfotelmatobacter sp.]|nr:hypothetical protein [Candidatus Sulfotelmatobacter sp.]